jgi:hypothetical protein
MGIYYVDAKKMSVKCVFDATFEQLVKACLAHCPYPYIFLSTDRVYHSG